MTFLGEGEETWLVQLNLALLLLEEGETEEARRRLEPLLAALPAESGRKWLGWPRNVSSAGLRRSWLRTWSDTVG